jgi:hypothetical protein
MVIKSRSRRGEVIFCSGLKGVPDAVRSSASDEGSDRPARLRLEGSGEGGTTNLGLECCDIFGRPINGEERKGIMEDGFK